MIFEITDKQKSPILLSQAGWGFCLCNIKPKKTKASINSLGVDIYRYMISLIYDIFGIFRFKSPAGFHKLAGIIISKRCK